MTQLYEWRGNECESEVQGAFQHASLLRRARASAAPSTLYHYNECTCIIHYNLIIDSTLFKDAFVDIIHPDIFKLNYYPRFIKR